MNVRPTNPRRARILVVEDDESIQDLIASTLRNQRHSVVLASTGRAAVNLARNTPVELIILDLGLPDLPGERVIEALFADSKTCRIPVIIVSARADEHSRVRGLELGASDYLGKPFSVRELVLRIEIALRRSEVTEDSSSLTAGPIRIEPGAHRAFLGDVALPLTPIEFGLLSALVSRAGQVQSREALLADVWGACPDLATRTVDTHIKRLRLKLGDFAEQIETVRGIGYRLTPDA